MRRLDWGWLWWQVGLPLFAPIFLSGIFAAFWWTLADHFQPNASVLFDMTPWALATYALTLVGSTLRNFWSRFTNEPSLGIGLIVVAVADTIYYSFMVIRRHDPLFDAGFSSYFVMCVLVVVAIFLCYRAR